MKLPVPDKQQVIKAFSPHTPQEPFADGVGLWSTVGRLGESNRARLSDSSRTVAVLAVPVENRETRGRAIEGRFPTLLWQASVG